MKKILSLFLITAFILVSFTGCNGITKKQKFTDYSFECFDTVTTIIGYENNKSDFNKNCEKIKNRLLEYHKLYDIYNSYPNITNLYTVNNSTENEIKVPKKIIDLIEFSKEMYQKTNGKFNVAMGSVLSIWHEYREKGIEKPNEATLPDLKLLKKAAENTDINSVTVNKSKSTVLKSENVKIDVGGVAKGYATEMVANECSADGINGYILNVGGNVKLIGEKYDNKPWTVGIENPDDKDGDGYIEKLSLSNTSLVTSGSYQRFYTVNGKKYHHIIDTDTLFPAEYFESVSVLTENSALADVLSTALFCMSYDDGLKLLNGFQDVEVMWVTNKGEKLYTNGFKKYIIK